MSPFSVMSCAASLLKQVKAIDCSVRGLRLKLDNIYNCSLPVHFQKLYPLNKAAVDDAKISPSFVSHLQQLSDIEWLIDQSRRCPDHLVCLEIGGNYMHSPNNNFQQIHVDRTELLEKVLYDFETKDNNNYDDKSDFNWYLAQQELRDVFPFLFTHNNETNHIAPRMPLSTGKKTLYRTNLWLNSSAGSSSPCHFDVFHNKLIQLHGTKKVLLFHPEAEPGLYTAKETVQKNTSKIDFDAFVLETGQDIEMDISQYPLFEDHAMSHMREAVTLKAGDALYIPKGWFHYCRADSFSMSVNYWWL